MKLYVIYKILFRKFSLDKRIGLVKVGLDKLVKGLDNGWKK